MQDVLLAFEEEQRAKVFSALSAFRRADLFTDVTLTCRGQALRAHKVVLAASSRFFNDLFKHNRGME